LAEVSNFNWRLTPQNIKGNEMAFLRFPFGAFVSLLAAFVFSYVGACTNRADLIGKPEGKKQKSNADQQVEEVDESEELEEEPVVEASPTVEPMPTPSPTPVVEAPPAKETDALLGLKEGPEQTAVICARGGNDKVRQVFCSPNPPPIASLRDLQAALGLGFGQGNDPAFAFTGHSSSLVMRFVTSLNPRAIIFTPTNNNISNQPYVAMGFTRGEQFAEIAANDPMEADPAKKLKFFIVHFEQACNKQPGGVHHWSTPEPSD
jgi:hypothetical protein